MALDILTPVKDYGSKQLPEHGIADIAPAGLFLFSFCGRCSKLCERSVTEQTFVSVSDKLLSAFPRRGRGRPRADIAPEIALTAMPVTDNADGEEASGLRQAAVLAGLAGILMAFSYAVALYCFHRQDQFQSS